MYDCLKYLICNSHGIGNHFFIINEIQPWIDLHGTFNGNCTKLEVKKNVTYKLFLYEIK